MIGDLRTRLERERDVLEHLVYHPCPCPRTTPVPEVAAVTAIIDHLARILDADPDTPTTDAPVDDGQVEQVARVAGRIVNEHRYVGAYDSAEHGVCICMARDVVDAHTFRLHFTSLLVDAVARPWQAEVEAARQDALNQAADDFEARPYEQHTPEIKPASHGEWWVFECKTCGHWESGSEAHLRELKAAHESMGSPLRPEVWLRDRAARGETRQP